mgnify:CR=1 FL=1
MIHVHHPHSLADLACLLRAGRTPVVVTQHADRLLTREDVRVLTEGVKQVSPSAVDELVPGLLTLAEVQRVLQGLLSEQVPINDLPRIYEALALRAKMSTDPEGLIEAARQALRSGQRLAYSLARHARLRAPNDDVLAGCAGAQL